MCEEDIGSVQFDKWSLCLRSARQEHWEEHSLQKFISARLLEMIASQGFYRYVAYDGVGNESKNALLVSFENL